LIFFEGFRELFAKDKKIPKILVVNSLEEAKHDLNIFRPIIALTGPTRLWVLGSNPQRHGMRHRRGQLGAHPPHPEPALEDYPSARGSLRAPFPWRR
jgi:hypothetical protein